MAHGQTKPSKREIGFGCMLSDARGIPPGGPEINVVLEAEKEIPKAQRFPLMRKYLLKPYEHIAAVSKVPRHEALPVDERRTIWAWVFPGAYFRRLRFKLSRAVDDKRAQCTH
jgi:hypothetical protein